MWDFTGPIYDAVLHRGQAFRFEDQRLVLERHGGREETYFTLAYSGVPDGAGGVGGVLVSVFETSAQVGGRRAEAERAQLAVALQAERTALLEEVFRRSPSFLHVLRGPKFVFEFVNAAYYQLGATASCSAGPPSRRCPRRPPAASRNASPACWPRASRSTGASSP
ncbi:hypothetical protein tb265_45900 [Gemmatimonadetes bacterium T265]|nr:hypothetical protein tb265_45900 [Gemmatimonadetes bacterium T265]